MITVFFHLTTKPGADNQAAELLREMTQVSRADDGCVNYIFHQQRDDRRQWLLYEQWRDRSALEGHVASMKAAFGEPPAGARLPARLHDITESSHYFSYDVLA